MAQSDTVRPAQTAPFKERLKKTDFTVLIGPARINDAGRNQDRKCDDADVAEKTSYGPPYLYCV